MKLLSAGFILFAFFTTSCNNQSNTATSSATDSLSASSLKIKNSIDTSKASIIVLQNRIQFELDSMSKLLNNAEVTNTMKPDEFRKMQSVIGKRLSVLEKITKLEPLEQELTTTYSEVNNTRLNESVRKEKLDKLASLSKTFQDSIKSTIFIIENNK